MKTKLKFLAAFALITTALIALGVYLSTKNIAVLNPRGAIAQQEYELIVLATVLMLIIVIPVFALTAYIPWKYRASNTKAKYQPEWDGSRKLEAIWWGFPMVIILLLSVVTWQATHDLDPFKPIASNTKPLTVQVVALQWKWLFIYPEQGVATVNELRIPEDRPINFEITADAPMNSFWIPQLGGQVYAMAGMETKLHLIADQPGTYRGASANLSGAGFADMKFLTRATSAEEFEQWVTQAKQSPETLSRPEYDRLARPGIEKSPTTYSAVQQDLQQAVILKYKRPTTMEHDHR